jgi:hypothetical protein
MTGESRAARPGSHDIRTPDSTACAAPGCSEPLAGHRRRFCSDLCRIRGQRSERKTETGEFGRAAIRMIRQMAKRVGASDIAEFGLMWEIMAEAERAVMKTIGELRACGYTWDEIGAEAGASKQSLSQWYKRRSPAPRDASDHEIAVNGSFTTGGA